ncbi:Protein priB [Hypsizygus marmoreus]|uniref:Protein priB n=1 Tax=Hypsizygus marmoreus TaxID=39966 RepID=A0A369K0F4_HYPMA|nr:Protein priB [Hypsizygus marmoreus]
MSNPYNSNQPWGQHQNSFAQVPQPNQAEEYDFTAVSGTSSDIQAQSHQSADYTYHPSQLQHQSSSAAPPALMRSTFAPTQMRPEGGAPSFGVNSSVPLNPDSFNQGTFGSSPTQSQNVESYNTIFTNPIPSQRTWNNAPYGYQNPSPSYAGSGYDGTSESTYFSAHLSSSPSGAGDTIPIQPTQPSHYSLPPTQTTSDPRSKRSHRQLQEESRDDDLDAETVSDAKEGAKAKPGACARCKNLKVKCEFKTDTDPCKRCLNAGQPCVIPGRKKRRTPPKREHLLNQIREQATQIKDLMAQLEKTGASPFRRAPSITSDSFASSSGLQSPALSPSAISFDATASQGDSERNKAVADWIAKAKQSFEEFDVFIGIGGAAMPKSYLVDGDLENPDADDEDDYDRISDDEQDDYEIAVEHPDGDDVPRDEGILRHKSSVSSLGTTGAGVPAARKKHSGEGAKPVNLPGEAAPFGLFGKLSLTAKAKRASSAEAEEEEEKVPGIANTNFFRPTPGPQTMEKRLAAQPQLPPILKSGIITPKEIEKLFEIYFENMNLSVSLLDPVLYTAQKTYYRSPFLFTVICAIASRFYSERPELYSQVMHYAQQAAGLALISGRKNVEMCQAYILLSLYPVPAKRWEDQRSWLYLGLAIRTATDLNLHLPNTAKPQNENHAREMLNRTRVWLNCFNLDRSTGSQYGKPPIISSTDYMANHSEDWWKSSPYNMKNFDIHICAYNAELKVMAGFVAKLYSDPDHPTGLNREVDFEKIATDTDDELKQLEKKWLAILEETDMGDRQNSFRTGLLRLAYPYARLIALSYGFQHAFGKNNTDENPFLLRCLSAASDVVTPVLNDLCIPEQRIFFRHGPEAQSVFVTFASAFLVKLLQPKFASYLTNAKRLEIRQLVQRVVDLLGSEEIAIDDHGPKLYSKFLKGLLAAPKARVDPNSPAGSSRKQRRPASSSGQGSEGASDAGSFAAANHPSPAHSASLSPAPRQAALDFEKFAPLGATDPFAPDLGGSNSLALHIGGGTEDGSGMNMMLDLFQPPLPFDEAIFQNIQSLSDPSGWQDTANYWFPQPLDTNYHTQDSTMYYMGGE